jgi:hypothetical protein
MHKAPKARQSLAPSVAEVRGFRRKPALRHKGGVSWRKDSTLLPQAGAQRHKENGFKTAAAFSPLAQPYPSHPAIPA